MIFTSPPYYKLRHYDAISVFGGDIDCDHIFDKKDICVKCGAWHGELGQEPHFKDYVKHLSDIFIECKRVLKPTGSLYINIGDTYTDKCLSIIPHRLAISLTDAGYLLRNTVIWGKKNAVPEPAKDRFSKKYEFVFFFTKKKKCYFHLDDIRKPYAKSTIQRIKHPSYDNHSMSNSTESSRNRMLSNGGANPGDITDFWDISVKGAVIPNSSNHIARFNIELLRKPILASCPEGGVVLDPFMGSGTTAIAALKYKRKYIGFEIKEKWRNDAIESIKHYNTGMFND